MIHCVGNSHSYFFTGTDVVRGRTWWRWKPPRKLDGFKTYNIGAATAWNLKKTHLPRIKTLPIKHGSKVILMLGEVDCRVHLPQKKNIKECVKRYFDGVRDLSKRFEIAVWAVHPPAVLPESTKQDVCGTIEERVKTVKTFNYEVSVRCRRLHLPYFSIFYKISKTDGTIKDEFTNDLCHLNQKAMPYALMEIEQWK